MYSHVYSISWPATTSMCCAKAARHVCAGDLVSALEARQKREGTGQSNTYNQSLPSCTCHMFCLS